MSHLFHCHEENGPWPQEAHGDLSEGLWVLLNGCTKTTTKKTTLFSEINVLHSACLCINIKMLPRIRFHIGNICQTYSIKVSTASGSLSTELKFPPQFIVLTAVLLDTSLTGAHCTLSGAFTAILLISRQKNNNLGLVISDFPHTVYNMLLLAYLGLQVNC